MERDEALIAHHEAGHAVAMHSIGMCNGRVSIEPDGENGGVCESGERVPDVLSVATRRAEVEHIGIILHAGSAAERIFRPEISLTHARTDHARLHFLLQAGEDDTAVQITWCSYIWQRAYALLADPWKWKLVVPLAEALQRQRTMLGEEVTRFLDRRVKILNSDPRMPNCRWLGAPPAQVRSPWHRRWYEGREEQMQPRFEVLMELDRLTALGIARRPLRERRSRATT